MQLIRVQWHEWGEGNRPPLQRVGHSQAQKNLALKGRCVYLNFKPAVGVPTIVLKVAPCFLPR